MLKIRVFNNITKRWKWVDAPEISHKTTGLVANRETGFVSEWDTFDLGHPGIVMAMSVITAADGDGETFGDVISPSLTYQVSVDGEEFEFGSNAPVVQPWTANMLWYEGNLLDPIGARIAYLVLVPRAIRSQITIMDSQSGEIYDGANNPSLTATISHTTG